MLHFEIDPKTQIHIKSQFKFNLSIPESNANRTVGVEILEKTSRRHTYSLTNNGTHIR